MADRAARRLRHRLVLVLAELVQTTAGKRITHPPTRCPNAHTLGPGEVLVGHQACLGHGGGHTTWTCRTCDQKVYGHRSTPTAHASTGRLVPSLLRCPFLSHLLRRVSARH